MNPVVGVILLLPLVVGTAVPVLYTVERVEIDRQAGAWEVVEERCQVLQNATGCTNGMPVAHQGMYCRNVLPDPASAWVCDVKRRAYEGV